MSLLINCQDIDKSLGPRSLFTSLSFTVNKNDRLAIIGANGSGKTTLLHILAGMDTPDNGRVNYAQNLVIGFLPQQENFAESSTVLDILLKALGDTSLDEAERHNRAHTMLSRAGFDDTNIQVGSLSGGWRKRLAISVALVHQPDLLVLDEPTNHLDLEGIIWLEKLLLSSYPGCPSTFVIVSHDRFFLERLSTRILEIAPVYPEGYFQVSGNYSFFLQRKEQFIVEQQARETRLANQVRRENEWLERGPKARTTKARFRINEAHRIAEELHQLKSRNRARQNLEIEFEATGRKTKKLLEAKNLTKTYENKTLFTDVNITLSPGKRVGLLGKNGCGKSTLLQILAGATHLQSGLQPDSGSVRIGEGVNLVYFAQGRKQLNTELSLRQALAPEGDSVLYQGKTVHVVTWAHKFLFRTDQLDTPVANLSGGEQARILIAELMRQPADILLLDEPTNDLDIPSLQVLEESLLEFPGAVVLVTHDRYLLNRVCDYVLGFDGRGGVERFADFTQWHRTLTKEETGSNKSIQVKEKKSVDQHAGRLSYLDQREYDEMENVIMGLEQREQELLTTLEDPQNAADHEFLQKTWQEQEELRTRIDALYNRWDELETKKNKGT